MNQIKKNIALVCCVSLFSFMMTPSVGATSNLWHRYQEQGGELIKRVNPVYPMEARVTDATGTVLLEIVINKEGLVSQCKVVESSGNEYLDQAAIDAVSKWEFTPFTLQGMPQAKTVRVPIVFSLQDPVIEEPAQ